MIVCLILLGVCSVLSWFGVWWERVMFMFRFCGGYGSVVVCVLL